LDAKRKRSLCFNAFYDGQRVSLDLTVKVVLFRYKPGGGTEEQEFGPYTCHAAVDVYNKATFLATNERWVVDETGGHYVVGSGSPPDAPTNALHAIDVAIGHFGSDHAKQPSTGGAAQELHKPGALANLKANTVVWYVTHCDGAHHVRASLPDTSTSDPIDPWMTIDELSNAVGNGRTVPKINLVVLIACEGGLGGDHMLPAFGLGGAGSDQALIAFQAVIGDGKPEWGDQFGEWTDFVMKKLKAGYSAGATTAMADGQNVGLPGKTSKGPIRANTFGDRQMKLYGVYGSPEGDSRWYQVE